mmetsp:Transcript_53512/g.130284  ORF Transcript_53512/g.130284 Transcript_53512/m.130284 type:complete len:632 (-) Transcript_53512:219-2114(-)
MSSPSPLGDGRGSGIGGGNSQHHGQRHVAHHSNTATLDALVRLTNASSSSVPPASVSAMRAAVLTNSDRDRILSSVSAAAAAAAATVDTRRLANLNAFHHRLQQQNNLQGRLPYDAPQATTTSAAVNWILQQQQQDQLLSTSSDLTAARLAVAAASGLLPASQQRSTLLTHNHDSISSSNRTNPADAAAAAAVAAAAVSPASLRPAAVSSAFSPELLHQQQKQPVIQGETLSIESVGSAGVSENFTSTAAGRPGMTEDNVFRVDKVQEALLSKPQRGKKRDDLNQSERIALTRTRNREHAKSTRARKKARYQELLDAEDKYNEMKLIDDLRSERAAVLQRFLILRQTMLNDISQRHTPSSSADPSPQSIAKYISKLHDTLVDWKTGLKTDIEDLFFKQTGQSSNLGGGAAMSSESSSISATDHTADSVSQMVDWDRFVYDQVNKSGDTQGLATTRTNINTTTSFKYELRNGLGGIAISPIGTAFGRVNLVCSDSSVVLSGIVTATFSYNSSRLSKISWITIDGIPSDLAPGMPQEKMVSFEDKEAADQRKTSSCEDGDTQPVLGNQHASINHEDQDCDHSSSSSSASSNETLGQQLVHPSVVSLDHDKINAAISGGDSSADDLQQGPGMNI